MVMILVGMAGDAVGLPTAFCWSAGLTLFALIGKAGESAVVAPGGSGEGVAGQYADQQHGQRQ